MHIAQGASNQHIARTLVLSPHTVKRHVANILDELGLNSRGEAAAWWSQRQPRARDRIGGWAKSRYRLGRTEWPW